jgi:polysaccharide deacetylase 2 family uncharacterized protein YibQ
VDELSAPLGRKQQRKSIKLPINPWHAIGGVLTLFIACVAGWALTGEDPLGGEPSVVVAASKDAGSEAPAATAQQANAGNPNRYDGPKAAAGAQAGISAAAPNDAQTINIIDGSSGKSQQVVIVGLPNGDAPKSNADPRLLEKTRHGDVPRIAQDGTRPSSAYASTIKLPQGKTDAPRIAVIVTGLGISSRATDLALTKLPPAITFAFTPYGNEIGAMVSRARAAGHEVLLQAPMEPFDYPDNDPGPQTLLTSMTADQNIDRLHWLMSRFTGFVGIANYMGGRFTASDQAVGAVLREIGKRGLIYFDDGTSPRSVAGQIAGANNIPYAKSEIAIDATPTPVEIDRALGRLEAQARERGVAVGVLSALPGGINRVGDWAKKLEGRGFVLVPVTAVAIKAKSS